MDFAKTGLDELRPGDIVRIPKGAKCRMSAGSLAKHGLSVGFTSRAENSADAVGAWFARGGGAVEFAVAEARRAPAATTHGENTFVQAVRPLTWVKLVALDADGLPTKAQGGAVVPVPGLLGAATVRFRGEAAQLESGEAWSRGAGDGWYALRALADGRVGGMRDSSRALGCVPSGGRDQRDPDKRIWRRVFMGVDDWGWQTPGRRDLLYAKAPFLAFLEGAGAEFLRPSPEEWARRADRLFARHAKACAKELSAFRGAAEAAFGELRRELAELGRCARRWAARSAALERRLK